MSIASRINEMTEHLRNDWNSINKLGLKSKKLPDEYKQVEYIESSGTQYIDTGFIPNFNTEVELEFLHQQPNSSGFIYGSRIANNNNCHAFILFSGAKDYYPQFSNNASVVHLSNTYPELALANTKYKVKNGKNGFYVNNIQIKNYDGQTSLNSIYPLYIFGLNEAGNLETRTARARIYYFKIYDNDILVRDFIPCYRNSDNEVGLYDLVNDVFYANQGTGSFTYGEMQEGIPNKNIKNIAPVLNRFYNQSSDKTDLAKNGIVGRTTQNHTIPVEYTRVDYIESSGTQYIDTGVKANQDTITDVTLEINQFTEDYNVYFGSRYQFGSQAYELMSVYRPNYGIDPCIANTYNNGYVYTDTISTNTKYNIRKEKNVAYLDGNIIADQEYAEFETPVNMYIFATNSNGNANYKSSIRLYKMTISDGTNMLRDFIPCYRNSDNVVGLYDLVNDVFYTNQGTGVFTYGNIILEPSPDYPLEINNLSGNVEYKVKGKNLFDINNALNNNLYNQGTSLSLITNGIRATTEAVANYRMGLIKIGETNKLIGKRIRVKANFSSNGNNNGRFYIGYCDASGNNRVSKSDTTTSGSTLSMVVESGSGENICLVLYSNQDATNYTIGNYVDYKNITMTIDNEDMTYEPHISESFPLGLKSRNLFDSNGKIIENFMNNSGMTYTLNNGIYTLNGTNTQRYIYLRYNVELEPGSYIFTGCPKGGSFTGYSCIVRVGTEPLFDYGDGILFTLTEKETVMVYPVRVGADSITVNNLQFKPMLEKVDNLFDKDNANIINAGISAKVISTSQYNRLLYIPVKSSTTYTIQRRNDGDVNRFRVGSCTVIPANNVSVTNAIEDDNATNITITTGVNDKYLAVMYYRTYETVITEQQILDSIQIEEGSTPTDYEPYYDIELCNISDYKDRIYSQNGEFYLEKKTGKVVLDGSENITQNYNQSMFRAPLDNFIHRIVSPSNLVKSNYYTCRKYTDMYNGILETGLEMGDQGNDYIYIRNKDITSINDFKTWLSTHNTEVQYVLATPTTTEITQENYPTLYSQLLAIQEFLTKYKINKEFLLDYSSPEIEY